MCFKKELNKHLHAWLNGETTEEALFEHLLCKDIRSLSSEEAYRSIPDTIDFLLALEHNDEYDEYYISSTFDVLRSLASRSKTTQIPEKLALKKNDIDALFRSFSDRSLSDTLQEELRQFYRYYRM